MENKILGVGKELENILVKELGLTPHTTTVNKIKYFTKHPEGKQVKISYKDFHITLMDNKGKMVKEDRFLSINQIKKFLN